MTLKDRIAELRKDREHYEQAIKEARKELWEAHYVTKNDERRHGESDAHWEARRKRNRTRFEHRDEVVAHLRKKKDALQKEIDKLVNQREEIKDEHHDQVSSYNRDGTRIVTFDGKSCVEKAAYWCDKARKDGRWGGVLVSGYRTPQYSQSLCFAMCGAPSCPGRCAGVTSNHTKTTYPGPAVDVSDYGRFESAMSSYGNPLRNDLPYDPVHFSPSGH